jgi:hypothetical protein
MLLDQLMPSFDVTECPQTVAGADLRAVHAAIRDECARSGVGLSSSSRRIEPEGQAVRLWR